MEWLPDPGNHRPVREGILRKRVSCTQKMNLVSFYYRISSILLLQKVGELLEEHCFLIENIDATIIAQAPKMRPHIDQMRQNMADALKIDVSQINVKATTEEGLGFTGAGEGISAQAICLLNSPMGLYDQNVTSGCGGCGGCGVQ